MDIARIQKENTHVFELKGKLLGGPEAQVLVEELQGVLDSEIKNVVIDLTGIDRMNSSGLGVLISLFTTFKKNGGYIKLSGAKDNVKKLFEITKLTNVFELYDSVEEALQ